jgi:hypothetical protein
MKRTIDAMDLCPQCGDQVPVVPVGRPRRFCTDDCRKRWHADTSIMKNELAWRIRLESTHPHQVAKVERLEALIASRR